MIWRWWPSSTIPSFPPAETGGQPVRTIAADELALERLAAIVEGSDDAIVSKDLNGTITSWNRAAERVLGYRADEIVGRPIHTIVPDDRFDEEDGVLARIRSGYALDHFETVRRRKDGSLVEVSITVSPVRGADGRIVGASTIARDITERRRHERVQEEFLERERAARAETSAARDRLAFLSEVAVTLGSSLEYEHTLENAVHLALPKLGDYCTILVQDDNGVLRLLACGHRAPEEEPVVREFVERLLEQSVSVPTFSAEIMAAGRPRIVPRIVESRELEAVRRGHPELLGTSAVFSPCSYVGVPLVVRGRAVGVLSFGTLTNWSNREYCEADLPFIEDFAHRVALSIENARLFRQAADLNRLKDEFLATLSHELRTPLNAILGWTRVLAGGKLKDDGLKRAVTAIERNANAQARIVDDMLDVARGIAGNLQVDMAPLDLNELAQRGVDAIIPSAAARQVDVELACSPSPVMICGDAGRLMQVLGNLLSNAVKFTPEGGHVVVTVREAGADAELSVADSGVGIPAAFLPHVFDKFRQADGSFTRRYGGLGLGLAITRHLVELHRGTIEVRSAGRNAGSTFVVRIPLQQP